MYNPLFLFGGPGTGKTHMLTAIGKALQDQAPSQPVFLTTGPKLSRAAARAKASGKMGEIDAHIKASKALLIDDVHLLGVGEHNQEGLVAVLSHFFTSGKQVVLTSLYPPRALGALEDALKFQISSGWSVDMKSLNAEVQKEIVGPAMARAGFAADQAMVENIVSKLEGSFFDLPKWLRRLKALSELRAITRQPGGLQDLLPILFTTDPTPGAPLSTEEIQSSMSEIPAPAPAGAGAIRLAVCFPQGREAHAEYMLRHFQHVMKQQNWPLPVARIAAQAYDPEQLSGVPFVLGDACAKAGAQAALILGPNPGSGLAGKEVELQHAVDHLLDGIGIRMGWINFLRIKESPSYFRCGLDFFRGGAA